LLSLSSVKNYPNNHHIGVGSGEQAVLPRRKTGSEATVRNRGFLRSELEQSLSAIAEASDLIKYYQWAEHLKNGIRKEAGINGACIFLQRRPLGFLVKNAENQFYLTQSARIADITKEE
jgi:hypothetical protein